MQRKSGNTQKAKTETLNKGLRKRPATSKAWHRYMGTNAGDMGAGSGTNTKEHIGRARQQQRAHEPTQKLQTRA